MDAEYRRNILGINSGTSSVHRPSCKPSHIHEQMRCRGRQQRAKPGKQERSSSQHGHHRMYVQQRVSKTLFVRFLSVSLSLEINCKTTSSDMTRDGLFRIRVMDYHTNYPWGLSGFFQKLGNKGSHRNLAGKTASKSETSVHQRQKTTQDTI